MNIIMKNTFLLTGFILLFALIGCNKDDDGSGTGTLSIRITDAPFPIDLVEEANVTINKIEVRKKGDGSPFLIISEEEQNFNLLDLSNGVTDSLVEIDIPVGSYDLIRLYVDAASVVLKDGTEYDLEIPSGAQTGIKAFVKPAFEVAGGLTTELLLDFDVSKSFVVQGTPPENITGFHFKPVIRVANLSTAGRITGNVTDPLSAPAPDVFLSVIDADTTFTSTFSDENGKYALIGIPAGTYDLRVEEEGYKTDTIFGINVVAGNKTEQDIELQPVE
jgi:hypothetical protein